MKCHEAIVAAMLVLWSVTGSGQTAPQPGAGVTSASSFQWPNGRKAAVSLSFDDARPSQVDIGLPLLEKAGVKVTFFVIPSAVELRLQGWRRAVADGDEIGSHSLSHPCAGRYQFSKDDVNALENYDLPRMAKQLDEANVEIEKLLGVKAKTFAYPCGDEFLGRGRNAKSYVPLVAERFVVGRGADLDRAANYPASFDFAKAEGAPFDGLTFEQMKSLVDAAVKNGTWLIFAGHEIGSGAVHQTTDTEALKQLCAYLKDPANGVWLGTVDEIGSYIRSKRQGEE
jgi:peptidoglycan/xylan/chitin deacetylase (PgdA/CDA1 family)